MTAKYIKFTIGDLIQYPNGEIGMIIGKYQSSRKHNFLIGVRQKILIFKIKITSIDSIYEYSGNEISSNIKSNNWKLIKCHEKQIQKTKTS